MCFNFGAFVAPLICGFLQKEYGWHFGFGAGGIGMLLAVIIFYLKTMPDLKEFDEKVGIDSTWDRPSKKSKNAFYIIIVSGIVLLGAIFLILGGFIKLDAQVINKNIILTILACAGIYFFISFRFYFFKNRRKKKFNYFYCFIFSGCVILVSI
ncbi:hypothetical protein OLR46_08210 [Campylobacter jejuni]|nr:hypothetical protein [Campylobacter jejuni]